MIGSDPIERERLEIRARFAIGQRAAIRLAARGISTYRGLDCILNRDEIVRVMNEEISRYFAPPN
jgi:hypothetical protein